MLIHCCSICFPEASSFFYFKKEHMIYISVRTADTGVYDFCNLHYIVANSGIIFAMLLSSPPLSLYIHICIGLYICVCMSYCQFAGLQILWNEKGQCLWNYYCDCANLSSICYNCWSYFSDTVVVQPKLVQAFPG